MAAVLGLSLLALIVCLIFDYHAVLLVDGRMSMSISLSEEEDLQLEAQLKSLNKLPTKTVHADWGDIYDCIEFHKQPAFDHPSIKKHEILISNESLPSKSKTTTLFRGIDGCPEGTVPIRRTTKEDLIRARTLSSPLSSWDAHGDIQYRAGYTLAVPGQQFYGGSGTVNIWNPQVEADQFSSAEIALKGGPNEQVNGIKFGWMVNPQLYGDYLTRGFAYWTGDGSHKTGCYNTLCAGYVQVHERYTPDILFTQTSIIGLTQVDIKVEISLERDTGKWWLILQDNIRMGYWPTKLFPLFQPGVDYIYWGGRVKSGKDGAVPPMCSGRRPQPSTKITGYFLELQYKDKNGNVLKPQNQDMEVTNDCIQTYSAKYYAKHNQIKFGGAPYDGVTSRCYS
ncbi:hypothetical protein MKW94_023826 [Papaver nudicaule]|uniref:Neprosin PEP catalytic domain-containing protein n=1 Tax=Papaver nudicaule TaxID=74823 RepID=A0AA41VU20_PAPNU|nr:hypothetical protein [Papaver nudicaule]